jgi:hypothetical protein
MRARVITVAGLVAAALSVAQYALGVTLAGRAVPKSSAGQASGLFEALSRLGIRGQS